MRDEIQEKTIILPPFKHFIMSVGEIPTSYLESMTYYEMLVWFTNYLGNSVIPAVNENGEAVTELQELFVKLQTYVNDYFDNLDVQEEINNKLDGLVEDGTLPEIITNYLNTKALFIYNSVSDMLQATNLVDGSYAKTLGYSSIGDSLYQNYYITNTLDTNYINITLNNGLYARVIDRKVDTKLLNITNFNDLSNYSFINIDEIIIDKNYNITNSITFNDLIIDLNDKTLTLDLQNHNNIVLNNNCTIKNGKITTSDSSLLSSNNGKAIVITGNNNIIDNIEFETYISIYSESNIDNIEIKNCLLNSFRHEIFFQIGKFTNINIHNNKQTRVQNYTTPVQHHNNIQLFNKCNYPGTANMITNSVLNDYGDNIVIKDNEFNSINTRSINMVNFHHVLIEGNITINPFGDKTDHTLVGFSDDIYVCDFCKYGDIRNNVVINSGENGIDLLSCKYFNVYANKLIGTDITGIAIQISDINTEGNVASEVTNEDKISEYIICTSNIIESCSVGISSSGRYITATGNTIKKHPQNKDTVAFALSGNSVINAIGNYGTINLKDNNIDPSLYGFRLTGGANTIWNNENTNMILDEASGLHEVLSIDNSALANDSDTQLVRLDHGLKFKNLKIYFLVNNKPVEVPLSHGIERGIVSYDNQQSHLYLLVYKRFLNIPLNSGSSSYYNTTVGDLQIYLF